MRQSSAMRQSPATRHSRGFTLIELLVVIVIISILASIAIPRFGAAREQALISAMQSDLRNLQAAQELHYSTHSYVYASTLAELEFTASEGVQLTLAGDANGWSASASHSGADVVCDLYVGTGTAAIAQNPGIVTCSMGAADGG